MASLELRSNDDVLYHVQIRREQLKNMARNLSMVLGFLAYLIAGYLLGLYFFSTSSWFVKTLMGHILLIAVTLIGAGLVLILAGVVVGGYRCLQRLKVFHPKRAQSTTDPEASNRLMEV